MDYKKNAVQVRSLTTRKFDGDVAGSSQVVGAVVEAALRRSYRPQPTEFPTQVSLQTAAMHKSVFLKDVLPPGFSAPQRNVEVKVFPRDADLALSIVKGTLSKLMDLPYNLEVTTVDHANNSQCRTSHDICMATRLVGTSCLPMGAYSIEVKCREVQSKTAFNWFRTLTSEAMPLWRAELQDTAQCRKVGLRGRILVFACMARPCHLGPASVHAAINYTAEQKGWQVLFGWKGFKQLPECSADNKGSGPRHAVRVAPPVAAAAAAAEAPSAQWEKIKGKLVSDGEHFKLSSFCQALRPKLDHLQVTRQYIKGPNAWRLGRGDRGRGTKLASGTQWVKKAGHRGGVPAVYVEKDALGQVFYKYFAKK